MSIQTLKWVHLSLDCWQIWKEVSNLPIPKMVLVIKGQKESSGKWTKTVSVCHWVHLTDCHWNNVSHRNAKSLIYYATLHVVHFGENIKIMGKTQKLSLFGFWQPEGRLHSPHTLHSPLISSCTRVQDSGLRSTSCYRDFPSSPHARAPTKKQCWNFAKKRHTLCRVWGCW